MKKLLLSTAVLAVISAPAFAESDASYELTATTTLATEYIFRGLTQTDEGPAIQGSFDFAHETGFYAGVWASNVDFNANDNASTEFDFYGGFSNELENGLSYDLGFVYYAYPNANDGTNYDFWEAYVGLGYDFGHFAVGASVNHSPEFFADSGDATYYKADLSIPMPREFEFSGHIAYQAIDDEAAYGFRDYMDWSLGVSRSYQGFDFDLRYHDTDIADTDGADESIVFSISKTF